MNDSEFAASWQRYANDELANIGFETPGLMGATFVADNTELKGLSETFLPETDNFPQRISSSTVGMRDPSPLYGYLLNIENRRRVFTESDYVAQQFAPSFREQTLASFELERINGLVEPNPHIIHPLPYYWDALSDLLEDEDMRTVPLLLMGSSPREQRILAGKGDA